MGMVVRTNVMAMNAFRQLNMNNSQVGKSLEKLSSGFRINRAGDDASGLAISEKMKAQIKGLETASSNSQDGISLVQTAEGALTEVHDMLNRMVELAGKAANGTMDDPVDRKALQEELDALKSEINRIAEGTNFNGIKLLDGSMGAAGTVTETAGNDLKYTVDNLNANVGGVDLTDSGIADAADVKIKVEDVAAHKGEATVTLDGVSFKFESGDNTSALNGKKINVVVGAASETQNKAELVGDTITITLKGDNAANDYKAGQESTVATQIQTALQASGLDGMAGVTVSVATGTFTGAAAGTQGTAGEFENGVDADTKKVTVTAGTETFTAQQVVDAAGGALKLENTGKDKSMEITLNNNNPLGETKLGDVKREDGAGAKSVISFKGKKGVDVIGSSFTVEGKTFEFVKAGEAPKNDGATAITIAEEADDAAIAQALEQELAAETAITNNYTVNMGADGFSIEIENATPGADSELAKIEQQGTGLTLQIGDTADHYNQISVSINAMSTKGLGIGDISVASRTDASAALKALRDVETGGGAINVVSAQRAKLGALQNRLEHTINNLDVAAENMTSANMRIRDTDMAKEMMAYTKMNVLTQAAQAMLAQANQQPQSVLQLLQ